MTAPRPRLIVIQPALPAYRLDFFRRLARHFGSAFELRHARTQMGALSVTPENAPWAMALPPIRRFPPGLEWQPGILRTPLRRGDVLVVPGAPRNLAAMLLLIRARLRGARTVWWGHYWSSTSKAHRLPLRLALMKLADAVLFYTDEEVAAYRAGAGGSDRRAIAALNNGIDIEPIRALRQVAVSGDGARAILFIGRLTPKAELHLLLEAMADPRLADVHLHVIGDGPERDRMTELAARLGIEMRLTWHGGTTDERVIAAVAAACRLFVYPGDVGLSLLHAMAYGLPAVVHDDRWRHNPEIAAFVDGETGLAFRRGDAADLARAIAGGLAAGEQWSRWSDAARLTVETGFNTAIMSQRFVELCNRLGVG